MRFIYLTVITYLQALIAFGFGFVVCMLASIYDYQGGFDNFVGLTLFHPLWAIILSGLSVFLCLIVGLPIRLSKRVNAYWSSRLAIPILLFVIGLTLLLLSFVYFQEVYYVPEGTRVILNRVMASIGWFTAIFSLVHLFPPKSMLKFMERFSN